MLFDKNTRNMLLVGVLGWFEYNGGKLLLEAEKPYATEQIFLLVMIIICGLLLVWRTIVMFKEYKTNEEERKAKLAEMEAERQQAKAEAEGTKEEPETEKEDKYLE